MTADAALAAFEDARPRLFGIAYRMLGSVAEAEDLVQETWLRWAAADRADVREPAAFLATTITRLALTELDSARVRRERYTGPWLPEPVDTPAERAAYVLHEAFAYPFRRIAEILETSEANARQLARRARQRVDEGRRAAVDDAARDRLLQAFMAAAQRGDLAALEAVLAEDVVALSDGGGIVVAARKPVVGRARVAQFLLGVLEKFASDVENVPAHLNGGLAFIGLRAGEPIAVWTLDIDASGIRGFYNVLNPQKLSRIGGLSGQSG